MTLFCCRQRNILFTFYFLLKTQFQWKDHKHTDTVFSFCEWLDLINGWVVAALYFRVSSILVNWWLWFSCSYIFDYLICYMSNNRLPENKKDDAWCVITLQFHLLFFRKLTKSIRKVYYYHYFGHLLAVCVFFKSNVTMLMKKLMTRWLSMYFLTNDSLWIRLPLDCFLFVMSLMRDAVCEMNSVNLNWMNFADEHRKAIAVLTWSGWFTHDALSFPIVTVRLKLSHWAYVLSDKLGLTGCLILW